MHVVSLLDNPMFNVNGPLFPDRPPPRSKAQPPPDGSRSDAFGGQRQRDEQLGKDVPPSQRRERVHQSPGGESHMSQCVRDRLSVHCHVAKDTRKLCTS